MEAHLSQQRGQNFAAFFFPSKNMRTFAIEEKKQ